MSLLFSRSRRRPGAHVVTALVWCLGAALAAQAVTADAPPAAAATNPSATNVYGWGLNSAGQATAVAQANATRPSVVSGVEGDLVSVVTVKKVSYGLRADSTVISWGDFSDARLGRTSTDPAPIPGWTGITSISHSFGKLLAQRSSGGTYCLGGDCTAADATLPFYRAEIGQVTQVTYALNGTLIYLTSSGSVFARGVLNGQADPSTRSTMRQVPGLSGIKQIGAGFGTAVALDSSGRVWAWGETPGDGSASSVAPVRVSGIGTVTDVGVPALNGATVVAASSDGAVWQWGDLRPVAGGASSVVTKPVRLGGLPPVRDLTVGRSKVHALASDGTVWTWTSGGQAVSPVAGVAGAQRLWTFGDDGWSPNSTGYAATATGALLAWGSGLNGQLGVGDTTSRDQALQVDDLQGVTSLDGDGDTVLALGPTSSAPPAAPTCGKEPLGDWAFRAYVSQRDGLVLDKAVLSGPVRTRAAVRALQVSYVNVTMSVNGAMRTYKVELRADGKPQASGVTSALSKPLECYFDRAIATYDVRGLPGDSAMVVTQTYRFEDRVIGDKCEPTGSVACAPFWPTLAWKLRAPASGSGATFKSVETGQRFDFQPDGELIGHGMVFRDKLSASVLGAKCQAAVPLATDEEFTVGAINTFGTLYDNYHQSPGDMVQPPGCASPGCSECVHMHWRWTRLTNGGLAPGGATTRDFTDGKPAILPGSPQRAWITVVNEHLDKPEDHPASRGAVQSLADGEMLHGAHQIVFWQTSSEGIKSSDGKTFFDAAFPYRSTTQAKPGDRASIWFSPNP